MAFQWYIENEKFYHPIARATLRNILQLLLEEADVEALTHHNKVKQYFKA